MVVQPTRSYIFSKSLGTFMTSNYIGRARMRYCVLSSMKEVDLKLFLPTITYLSLPAFNVQNTKRFYSGTGQPSRPVSSRWKCQIKPVKSRVTDLKSLGIKLVKSHDKSKKFGKKHVKLGNCKKLAKDLSKSPVLTKHSNAF